MSFWTTVRQEVRYSETNEGDLDVSMQIKKAPMPSHVTLTFLISQGEDSAGAVSTLHNEVLSDTLMLLSYSTAHQMLHYAGIYDQYVSN